MNILKEYFKQTIKESIDHYDIAIEIFERVPFLNDYNIFRSSNKENLIVAQKLFQNQNVKKKYNDGFIVFQKYDIYSNIAVFYRTNENNISYHFYIENKIDVSKPENLTDLEFRILTIALKEYQNQISYFKTIRLKPNEELTDDILNEIINDMNKTLLNLEQIV
jgi:hypothetical protein